MEDRFNTRDPNSNINQLIVSTPFFAGLPAPVIERATVHIVTRSHPPNQVILLENDWGTSVYFILDGWVKIRTYNLDGKEVTLNILGKGELFGEMAAIEEAPRSTDVITLAPTLIGNMPSQDFVQLIHTEPLAGIRLAQLMARWLRQVNRRLRLRESDSTSRVSRYSLVFGRGARQNYVNRRYRNSQLATPRIEQPQRASSGNRHAGAEQAGKKRKYSARS